MPCSMQPDSEVILDKSVVTIYNNRWLIFSCQQNVAQYSVLLCYCVLVHEFCTIEITAEFKGTGYADLRQGECVFRSGIVCITLAKM